VCCVRGGCTGSGCCGLCHVPQPPQGPRRQIMGICFGCSGKVVWQLVRNTGSQHCATVPRERSHRLWWFGMPARAQRVRESLFRAYLPPFVPKQLCETTPTANFSMEGKLCGPQSACTPVTGSLFAHCVVQKVYRYAYTTCDGTDYAAWPEFPDKRFCLDPDRPSIHPVSNLAAGNGFDGLANFSCVSGRDVTGIVDKRYYQLPHSGCWRWGNQANDITK